MTKDALRTLTIFAERGCEDAALARVVLDGTTTSAVRVTQFSRGSHGEISVDETARRLREQSYEVMSGDSSGLEAMLVGQTAALNSIFLECSRLASLRLVERPDDAERFMRMAFKAQSLCRVNIDTLRLIKTPPALVAGQMNVSNGPQQVNAWISAPVIKPEAPIFGQNELIRDGHEEFVDGRTTGAAGCTDKEMEALGAIDGAKKQRRKESI